MWARNKSSRYEICDFFFSAIIHTLLGTLHFISALRNRTPVTENFHSFASTLSATLLSPPQNPINPPDRPSPSPTSRLLSSPHSQQPCPLHQPLPFRTTGHFASRPLPQLLLSPRSAPLFSRTFKMALAGLYPQFNLMTKKKRQRAKRLTLSSQAKPLFPRP